MQNEYLDKLREIKSVSFATVDDDGNPQVRIIDIMLVEKNRIYFLTARGKEFYNQLLKTEKVAIVGMTKDYEAIRINGIIEHVDKQWVDKMFDANPVMNDVYPGDSRSILEAFCIINGYGESFNLGNSPIARKLFSLGTKVIFHGYEINESCIECDHCRNICPQQCIDKGSPYYIRKENCLHCGLCYEECPVSAIVRK